MDKTDVSGDVSNTANEPKSQFEGSNLFTLRFHLTHTRTSFGYLFSSTKLTQMIFFLTCHLIYTATPFGHWPQMLAGSDRFRANCPCDLGAQFV